MPGPQVDSPALKWVAQSALANIAVGDWLVVASAIFGIAVAIVIAWRQRVNETRDRLAARAEQELRALAEKETRDPWREEYGEFRALLRLGEDIVSEIRHHGPLTAEMLTTIGAEQIVIEAEQLVERKIEPLQQPLTRLIDTAQRLLSCAIPAGVLDSDTATSNSEAPGMVLRDVTRTAIQQDRAARDLATVITDSWLILRTGHVDIRAGE